MIKNIPDAITEIISDMQTGVLSNSAVTVGSGVTVMNYTVSENIYKVGMWVTFSTEEASSISNSRYKIAKLTQVSKEVFTVQVNKEIAGLNGQSDVTMYPFLLFKFGNNLEIQQLLIEEIKGNVTKKNMFPLLWLIVEYDEISGSKPGILFETNVSIVLITDTNKLWKATSRLTYSFKQQLYPLYDLLIDKLIKSPLFQSNENNLISHTKTDRYFWSAGKADKQNTLSSIVDAIEINNLKLILNKQTKCN